MIKTQVQIPDELFRRAKEVAARKEWSFAEIVRRGLEDAAFINAYERARLQSTFGVELPTLDEKEAQVVAPRPVLTILTSFPFRSMM